MTTQMANKQIPWQDKWTLNHPKMDETHHEFIAEINHMLAVPDSEMLAAVDRFIEHTVAHFEQERVWMESTNFPPKGCHIGEHDRVLAIVKQVRQMVEGGDYAIGRRLAEERDVVWVAPEGLDEAVHPLHRASLVAQTCTRITAHQRTPEKGEPGSERGDAP